MILSGKEIEAKQGKEIIITPFSPARINPNSYNLSLHNELMVYTEEVLDMKRNNPTALILIPQSGYTLQPNRLYLGRTAEHTETTGYVPMLEGRSSIGRLGLFIHITAGFGDIGFKGFWTLEMFCVQPITIYPDVEICQIYFHEIKGGYDLYAGGKYHDNTGIQPSMLYKEFAAQRPDERRVEPRGKPKRQKERCGQHG